MVDKELRKKEEVQFPERIEPLNRLGAAAVCSVFVVSVFLLLGVIQEQRSAGKPALRRGL